MPRASCGDLASILQLTSAAFDNPRLRFVTLAVVVALTSGAVLFSRLGVTEFHGDESGWITSGRYYTDLVSEGNFQWDDWECPKCNAWGSINMQLGKLLIGIPVALDPQASGQAFSSYYDFGASLDENTRQGRVPPRETLIRARSASAVFGVLCCVVVFAIGTCAYNTFVGVVAVALLLLNPAFVKCATRAMADIHYSFFLVALCLAVIVFVQTAGRRQALAASALCGILAGLACSVKVTGIVVGGGLFVVALTVQRLWFVRRPTREMLFLLGAFGLSASIVVYGLNPYFWPSASALADPAAAQELKTWMSESSATGSAPEPFATRYPHLGTITHVLEFPRMFGRWQGFMSWDIVQRRANWKGGDPVVTITQRLFREVMFPGEVLLLVFGMVFVARSSRLEPPGIADQARLVTLEWFLINYLFILAFMELNWERYYLPTAVAAVPLAAAGVYGIGTWLYRRSIGSDRQSSSSS